MEDERSKPKRRRAKPPDPPALSEMTTPRPMANDAEAERLDIRQARLPTASARTVIVRQGAIGRATACPIAHAHSLQHLS